jgi:ribosomal protein S27E
MTERVHFQRVRDAAPKCGARSIIYRTSEPQLVTCPNCKALLRKTSAPATTSAQQD